MTTPNFTANSRIFDNVNLAIPRTGPGSAGFQRLLATNFSGPSRTSSSVLAAIPRMLRRLSARSFQFARVVRLALPRTAFVALSSISFTHATALYAQPNPNAPALKYREDRMLERLIEIAEGPVPTMESLSAEFGVAWRVYEIFRHPNGNVRSEWYLGSTKGLYPLADIYDRGFKYQISHASGFVSIVVSFASASAPDKAAHHKYCMRSELIKGLAGDRWKLIDKTRHKNREISWERVVAGQRRSFTTWPPPFGSGCVEKFFLDIVPQQSEIERPQS